MRHNTHKLAMYACVWVDLVHRLLILSYEKTTEKMLHIRHNRQKTLLLACAYTFL